MAEAPQIILVDTDVILQEIVSDFQAETGKTLQPAHVETLLFNTLALRETLVREAIQYSFEQNLVPFANGLALDSLGVLVGVTRLSSSYAQCTVLFTLVEGHGGSIIPEGTRLKTADGKWVFKTLEPVTVPSDETTASIVCEATIAGAGANGYLPGFVNGLLDPLSFVSEVSNTTETDGGADEESDEELRDRIILASQRFSNAGSRGAYMFFAKSANPSIIDVWVDSTDPGTVQIYVLMNDGETTPTEVQDQVYAACNDEKVRPLTDLVTVFSAEAVEYEVEFTLQLYAWADQVTTLAAAEAALDALILEKRQTLGQDVPVSQMINALMVEGMYDAIPSSGTTSQVIAENQYAKCTSVVINLGTPVNE